MSGYNEFTQWIDKHAEYVMLRGQRKNIISTYFTADPTGCPNSDVFLIVLEGGQEVGPTDDAGMLADLRKRFARFLHHGPAQHKKLKRYEKLVRDKIPDKIRAKGEPARFHRASAEEYRAKLREKLIEEVNEFNVSAELEELADILEVIDAIIAFEKFDRATLKRAKKKKRATHGGFEKRLILDEA